MECVELALVKLSSKGEYQMGAPHNIQWDGTSVTMVDLNQYDSSLKDAIILDPYIVQSFEIMCVNTITKNNESVSLRL